jgi:hypothetical protein
MDERAYPQNALSIANGRWCFFEGQKRNLSEIHHQSEQQTGEKRKTETEENTPSPPPLPSDERMRHTADV